MCLPLSVITFSSYSAIIVRTHLCCGALEGVRSSFRGGHCFSSYRSCSVCSSRYACWLRRNYSLPLPKRCFPKARWVMRRYLAASLYLYSRWSWVPLVYIFWFWFIVTREKAISVIYANSPLVVNLLNWLYSIEWDSMTNQYMFYCNLLPNRAYVWSLPTSSKKL